MNRNANSPLAANFVAGRPSSSSFAVAEQLRQSHRPIRHAKVRYISPDYHPTFGRYVQPESPATLKGKAVSFVDGLQGNREAVAIAESNVKRFKVTVKDRVTGDPVEVLAKLEMRTVAVLCYGTQFHFTMKRGSQTCVDSRTGKRVPLNYVQSELCRMLGNSEGIAKFGELICEG